MAGATRASPRGRDAVWDVEEALSAPPFGAVRAGPLVNDLLVALSNGARSRVDLDLLRVARDLVRRDEVADQPPLSLTGRVLVTWIDDTPRFADLVLPVVDALGSRAVVLVAKQRFAEQLPSGVLSLHESQLGPGSRRSWAASARRVAPTWARSLVALVRDGRLPAGALPALAHLLIVQTRRVERYRDHFAIDQPDAVLAEYDRGAFAAPVVAAARSVGIPTMTMVHGALGTTGYTPPIADTMACWGCSQAELLRALGVGDDRLVITGCPRIGRAPVDGTAVRRRLGLDDRPVVLLATNNGLPPEQRRAMAETFLLAAEPFTDVLQFAIRTHPREQRTDYEPVVAGRTFVRWLDGGVATVDEVLAVADLVACGRTAFADEALIAGVPSVLIVAPDADRSVSVGLGLDGPSAQDAPELTATFKRWLDDADWRSNLARLAAERGRELCAHQGDEAAARVAQAVTSIAGGGA